jgi:hypothetical protein
MNFICVHAWLLYTAQGTYGSTSGLGALSDCTDCDTGAYCPVASTTSTVCPPGTYCGTRAANYTVCPGKCVRCSTLNSHYYSIHILQLKSCWTVECTVASSMLWSFKSSSTCDLTSFALLTLQRCSSTVYVARCLHVLHCAWYVTLVAHMHIKYSRNCLPCDSKQQ